ncbi:MAG: HAD family hydrolase [Polyangiales bacterium]
MSVIRHVIWDFNGTLLDDVDCCVATLNTLLAERNLPPLSREQYLDGFGFPVRSFYLELGFDLEREDFTELSRSYIERYTARVGMGARPQAEAQDAIAALSEGAIAQSVLSAMERSLLERLLRGFDLDRHMTAVRGLDHHGASSKIELGISLQREIGATPDEILLVGDTLHDAEAAAAIGCRCLLYSRGHQSLQRLERAGVPVCDSLSVVADVALAQGRS